MNGWAIAAIAWCVISLPAGVVIGKYLKRRDGR